MRYEGECPSAGESLSALPIEGDEETSETPVISGWYLIVGSLVKSFA